MRPTGCPTLLGFTFLSSPRTAPPSTRESNLTPLANRWPPMLTPFILTMMSHQRRRWIQRSDASSSTSQASTPTSARSISRRGSERPMLDREKTPPPSQTWKVDAASVNGPIYVEHHGNSSGIGVDHPGVDPEVKYIHLGNWPSGDAMEGSRGHHQCPPPCQHPFSKCYTRVLSG